MNDDKDEIEISINFSRNGIRFNRRLLMNERAFLDQDVLNKYFRRLADRVREMILDIRM